MPRIRHVPGRPASQGGASGMIVPTDTTSPSTETATWWVSGWSSSGMTLASGGWPPPEHLHPNRTDDRNVHGPTDGLAPGHGLTLSR